MKRLLFAVAILGSTAFAPAERVFICVSPGAYAYHRTTGCRGMKQCTHTIKEVTIAEAQAAGKKKPCGWCY